LSLISILIGFRTRVSKEELRELRAQFQKLISNEFVEVKRTLGKIDQYGLKESEMVSHESSFRQEKEVTMKDYIRSYEEVIDSTSYDLNDFNYIMIDVLIFIV
jgi:hypothetical protein